MSELPLAMKRMTALVLQSAILQNDVWTMPIIQRQLVTKVPKRRSLELKATFVIGGKCFQRPTERSEVRSRSARRCQDNGFGVRAWVNAARNRAIVSLLT